jgi:hypothetical protein
LATSAVHCRQRARSSFVRNFLFASRVAALALLLVGCEVNCSWWMGKKESCDYVFAPFQHDPTYFGSITPDEGTQGTDVEVTITGNRLDRLCVNGVSRGTADIRVIEQHYLVDNDSSTVVATLRIAPGAPRTVYEIGSLASGGWPPQSVVLFAVNGSSGAKTPRLTEVSPSFGNEGASELLVFTGQNFDETTTVHDLGHGLIFSTPIYDPASGLLSVPTYIEPGAASGLHRLSVSNSGGTSEMLVFELRRGTVTGPFVQTIAPNFLRAGETKTLQVFGSNFAPGVVVTLDDFTTDPVSVLSAAYQIDDLMNVAVQAPPDHVAETRVMTLTGVTGVSSGEIHVLHAAENGPSFLGSPPTTVTRDAHVFIKFTGQDFGPNGPVAVRIFPPFAAGPQAIYRSSNPAEHSSEFTLRLSVYPFLRHGDKFYVSAVRHDGLISEARPITIFETPAGKPHAHSVSKNIPRGAVEADNTLSGSHLQGATQIQSSVSGVTCTDITPSEDGTRVDFKVSVSASVLLPGDRAIELSVLTPDGVSNPVPLVVF